LKKQQHNLGLPILKLPQVLTSFKTNPLNIILTISVYDYLAIGPSSVVCIFHKSILSLVLCGYEEQMDMYFFDVG